MLSNPKQIVLFLQKVSSLRELKQAHALITKSGLISHTFLLNKVVILAALPKWGSLEYASSVFGTWEARNPILCNTMIRAYSRSLFPVEAIHIYNEMCLRSVRLDRLTYPFVLKALGRVCAVGESEEHELDLVRKGAEVHGRISRSGLSRDVFVENSLIMGDRTVASWNAMIAAHYRRSDFDSADSLLQMMPEKNVVSWNTVIARCVRSGDIGAARKVFEGMSERDAASWNSIIAGYIQVRDYHSALQLFNKMQIQRVEPTETTVVSLLHACTETGALEIGRQLHRLLLHEGFKAEGVIGNALLDMYAKCGNLWLARKVFDEMLMKHVTHWNSMIMALAVHGCSEEALRLFSSMEEASSETAKPNRVTFLGALLACSHQGLVEEGRRIFNAMVQRHAIEPDIKHYGCMVDLLSRGGFLQEANWFIRATPFRANPVLWRTLLAACCRHGNVEFAEEAFRELCQIEAPGDGDLVLLSNVYAEARRWRDGEVIRWGVSKQPGFSQIELDEEGQASPPPPPSWSALLS
ncbi:unnamed protein product [Spirodela intermedia]|uniref:Uncharacterized protein n=1 Tax=Spirodela intermedia TaxID=51605 RepID=A0A7I8IJ17_SPIIN|nr:unnamed protein product [Spirodela intermedia]CAA6656954.1 unnamed protein product [Spirodela intermedia]